MNLLQTQMFQFQLCKYINTNLSFNYFGNSSIFSDHTNYSKVETSDSLSMYMVI